MVAESTNETVVLKRHYATSPEQLFQIWTDPKYVDLWLRPGKEWTHPVLEIDLSVGGKYRIGFETADGQSATVFGKFLEIDAPHKLVYSWSWEEPDPHAGVETQVTVQFLEHQEGTELVLTHERIANSEMAESHRQGWTGALDLIPEVIESVR